MKRIALFVWLLGTRFDRQDVSNAWWNSQPGRDAEGLPEAQRWRDVLWLWRWQWRGYPKFGSKDYPADR